MGRRVDEKRETMGVTEHHLALLFSAPRMRLTQHAFTAAPSCCQKAPRLFRARCLSCEIWIRGRSSIWTWTSLWSMCAPESRPNLGMDLVEAEQHVRANRQRSDLA